VAFEQFSFSRGLSPGAIMRSLLASLVLILISVTLIQSQTSASSARYFKQATEKQAKGDLDGAIEDYTAIIALKSQAKTVYADAYALRATLRYTKRDKEGAMADFGEAIKLSPQSPKIYYQRAVVRMKEKDLDWALADLNHALELDPKFGDALVERAWLALYDHRGIPAYLHAGTFLGEKGTAEPASPYMPLVIWLGQMENNETVAAAVVIGHWLKQFPPSGWPTQIMRYLKGEVDQQELIAKAADNRQKTEAHTYIGMKLMLAGDKSAAIEHLRWVLDNGEKSLHEFELANYEMQRLGAPTKPL
jgi:lipoprotein NlpI